MEAIGIDLDYLKSLSVLDVSIGDIAKRVEPLSPYTPIMDCFLRFMKDEKLSLIPVVKDDIVIGQVQRNRFLEHTVLGRFGYGIHLNAKKCICEVMEEPTFVIEYRTTLEDASRIVQKREHNRIYDDIIVSKDGEYHGVVPINILLEAITQRAIIIAKDSNPLTGLPGNWAIQREIERRIAQQIPFEITYIDINNFKPYNDHYGFERGDKVIFHIGSILRELSIEFRDIFVGHIGGDDFIIVTPPEVSQEICKRLIEKFNELLHLFHGEDFIKGYYKSKNRKEEEEVFRLLSLTCATVSTKKRKITSYAHLASISSEVKAEAKRLAKLEGGSVIFFDRRSDL